MTFRSDVTVDWGVSPRIIEVAAPSATITIQDLWDTLRTLEAQPNALDDDILIHPSSGGKISAGTYTVVITIVLNNAKLRFEERLAPPWVVCTVLEGIIGAVDINGDPMDPRDSAPYTNVDISQAVSGSIDRVDLSDLKYRLESLRQSHMAFGKTIYWDHVDGDDSYDGLEASAPVKTFARAHELVGDHTNDVVVNSRASHEPITEAITITKHAMHLRMGRYGPTWTTPGEDAITINSSDVSVEGVVIGDCTRGVVATGPQIQISDCSIDGPTSHGIELDDCQYGLISECSILNCGGDGIRVSDAQSKLNHVTACLISNCTGSGIRVDAGEDFTVGSSNRLLDNGSYGIDIQASATGTLLVGVLADGGNVLGSLNDAGTDTLQRDVAIGEEVRQLSEKNIRRYLVRATVADATRNVQIDDWDHEAVIIKADDAADWSSPISSAQRKVAYEAETSDHDRPFYYIGHD